MQEISSLPGRIRLKSPRLYDREVADVVHAYTNHLQGVTYSRVNHHCATILIVYDMDETNVAFILQNLKNVLSSPSHQFHRVQEHHRALTIAMKQKELAKRNSLVYGLLFLLFKVKSSFFGRFAISRNIRLLLAASAITLATGYPLLKKPFTYVDRKFPVLSDFVLKAAAISLIFLREDGMGCLLLGMKSMNDYIKFSTDVIYQKAFNQSMGETLGMAWVHDAEGQEILIPAASLRIGDVIYVHKGEMTAAEGQILEGKAVINSSHHMGQPFMEVVGIGETIHEGIAVLAGEIKMKVMRLSRIAHKQDVDINELDLYHKVNRYQDKIGPIALGAATINYLVTGNLLNALSIVLLLCPTASEIAINTGMKRYLSLLGKHNIYLRNPNRFEKMVGLRHIVFDKTGTLTYGKMKIQEIKSFDKNYSQNEILKICSACEFEHTHPIAAALKETGGNENELNKVESSILLASKGISAIYDGQPVLIGNQVLMEKYRIDIRKGIKIYTNYEKRQFTPLFIVINRKLTGLIILQDILREDAYELMESLKKRNLQISLLSGDTKEKVNEAGKKLDISFTYGECTADNKAEIILQEKEKGNLMMVGDGINDISAMGHADISLSFANSSSDLAKLHADCIIFEDDLRKISDFIILTEASYKMMLQNIYFSRVYSIVLGTIAFLIPLNPFTAKSLNTLNSLFVMLLNKRIEYIKKDRVYKKG